MELMHDPVIRVEPGTTPDYNAANPMLKLLGLLERVQLAAEREFYIMGQAQYLFPFEQLELYGPQGADSDILDPKKQDEKLDFQKQNVRDFITTDAFLVRGLAHAGAWTGPFLRLSYRGGPDSKLSASAGHQLGEKIKLLIKVGNAPTPSVLSVPYNLTSDRYEIELWGYPGDDLRVNLDVKGAGALDRGELIMKPDLIKGNVLDFQRENIEGKSVFKISPDHAMHPILPLHVAVAWMDDSGAFRDPPAETFYDYEFNMILRGWENFLETGGSPNPHGGVGFLHYFSLLSNYKKPGELSRILEDWNFNAFGTKDHVRFGEEFKEEKFMAVDYMDLHVLKSECGIGLHRHRDNQEIFLMMSGRGYMIVGDWCKMPQRERCFEIRTLRSGHLVMLKGGNLHGLMNSTDEDISLFMFGGYD